MTTQCVFISNSDICCSSTYTLQDIDIITERKDGTTAAPPSYVARLDYAIEPIY
jgi:hypothetical protein